MVIAVGLAVRSERFAAPAVVVKVLGDALWAAMIYLFAGLLLPRMPLQRVAVLALTYSCATEFSQLYHAPWIDSIRRTLPGRLLLGTTFAWSDMLSYLGGVGVAAAIEWIPRRGVSPGRE